jgi:hypothetical protein
MNDSIKPIVFPSEENLNYWSHMVEFITWSVFIGYTVLCTLLIFIGSETTSFIGVLGVLTGFVVSWLVLNFSYMIIFENRCFRQMTIIKKYLQNGGILGDNQYKIVKGFGKYNIPESPYDIFYAPINITSPIAVFEDTKCIVSGFTGGDIMYKRTLRAIQTIIEKKMQNE